MRKRLEPLRARLFFQTVSSCPMILTHHDVRLGRNQGSQIARCFDAALCPDLWMTIHAHQQISFWEESHMSQSNQLPWKHSPNTSSRYIQVTGDRVPLLSIPPTCAAKGYWKQPNPLHPHRPLKRIPPSTHRPNPPPTPESFKHSTCSGNFCESRHQAKSQ